MASAALKIDDTDADAVVTGEGEGGDETQIIERDYDAEARQRGWAPEEDFKGDKARWVDAKTFVERTDTMMPLLKADRDRLKRELADFKRDARKMSAQIEGAEQRAFEKAKAELQAEVEAAIETGDLEAGKAALKKIDALKPVETASSTDEDLKREAEEVFDTFREENPWYDKANLGGATEIEINARLFFDRMVDKHIAKTKDMGPADFFAFITDMTLDKYPQDKGKTARIKPTSAVEPGGRGGGGRANQKTFDNLPDGAKRQCDRFVANGIIKTRDDYVKTYDWSKP